MITSSATENHQKLFMQQIPLGPGMSDRTVSPIPPHPLLLRAPTDARQASLLYLMSLLTHDDSGIRRRAAGALGRMHDAGALESLVMTLEDGDHSVQRAAIGALGAIGDPRAILPLRQLHPRVDRRLRATIEDAQRSIFSRQAERP